MLCTKKTPTLEFTTFFGNFKWSKREFQEVWWTIDFHKVLLIHQEVQAFYFSMGHSWYILPLRDLREYNVDGESNTERKKGHPTTPYNLVEKYSCDSYKGNCISNRCRECPQKKYFQDGMKLLLQKALHKDNQAVMRNPTKLLINNWLERMKKWKKLLNMWLKKRFADSGKKL